jgi:hypothetical protein
LKVADKIVEHADDSTAGRDLPTVVRTLVATGFILRNVRRHRSHALVECYRVDEFDASVPYQFILAEASLSRAEREALKRQADHRDAHLVFIGVHQGGSVTSISLEKFLARCGGPVKSWLPLEGDFAQHLEELGHNKLPSGLIGKPDDLFEEYVHAGLEFIFASRVIRYGQKRKFESLPDGLALPKRTLILPYDAKAYANGYPVARDSIRQFQDYVQTLNAKYENYLSRAHTFVLISGHFAGDESQLRRRSGELYSACQCPLAFLTARDLGEACGIFAEKPVFRTVIDWPSIFSQTFVRPRIIREALRSAERDRVIGN